MRFKFSTIETSAISTCGFQGVYIPLFPQVSIKTVGKLGAHHGLYLHE